MTAKIEYKGNSVDEAIRDACHKLNVSRDELEIEILSAGSSGIFGLGRKKAVIQVRLKASPAALEESAGEPVNPILGPDLSAPLRGRKPSVKPGRRDDAPPRLLGDDENTAPVQPPTPERLEEIQTTLATLLRHMGHDLEVSVEWRDGKAHGRISGGSAESLATDSAVLDAIQYLMRKMIAQKNSDRIPFAIDADDFRSRRKAELESLALSVAAQVKETGKSRTLDALNPAERRIIHVILQADPAVRSTSLGEGLFKKIKIFAPGQGGGGRKRSSRRRGKGRGPRTPNAAPTPHESAED